MPARRAFAAIIHRGWYVLRVKGTSHKVMAHPDFPVTEERRRPVFSFHDSDEIGHRMMARLAKDYHLRREDL